MYRGDNPDWQTGHDQAWFWHRQLQIGRETMTDEDYQNSVKKIVMQSLVSTNNRRTSLGERGESERSSQMMSKDKLHKDFCSNNRIYKKKKTNWLTLFKSIVINKIFMVNMVNLMMIGSEKKKSYSLISRSFFSFSL